MADKVVIYSDGGADPNPGIGGWAAVLRYGDREKVLQGSDPQTTNNRMELQAAIAALSALKRPSEIEFHTDSEYLRRGISQWIEKWAAKGWRRGDKPVPNAELWQELWQLAKQHDIEWRWVRGHAGDSQNERVDELAREARLAITPRSELPEDVPRLFVRASCLGSPGRGGWAAVLDDQGQVSRHSGFEPRTTNNRMELMGAVEGLRLAPAGQLAQLVTTSDYVLQGATRWIHSWRQRNWQKKDGQPVSNADLWQELDREMARREVQWVSAKGGDPRFAAELAQASELAANTARSGRQS